MSAPDKQPPTVEDLLAGYPVVVRQMVVWGEMDAYNHVNNVVYFRYLENARLEYFRRMGWFEFEDATQVGPILAATTCRFREPLVYPEAIAITARVTSAGKHSFTLHHRVVNLTRAVVAAEGEGVVVSYHYGRGEKVPLPDELRQGIAALEAEAGRPRPEGL